MSRKRTPPTKAAKSSWKSSWTGTVDHALMAVAIVCAALFLVLTLAVVLARGPLFFDRPVSVAVQSADPGTFAPFNSVVSALGGVTGVAVGVVVIVLTLIFRRAATPFVAFSAVYSLVYNGVDFLVRRPRPTGLAHFPGYVGAYSFPSGHVAFFVWLAVLGMVLLGRGLPRGWHRVVAVLAVALVVLGALSRIDVGAHWPSDVVGGLLVGIGWMALSLSLGRLTGPAFGDTSPMATLRADRAVQ